MRYQKLQQVSECCLSTIAQAHNLIASRLLLCKMIRCSKSAQKSAVHCSTETTQLVLSQFFTIVDYELNKVSLCPK